MHAGGAGLCPSGGVPPPVPAKLPVIFKKLAKGDPSVRANASRICFVGLAIIFAETTRVLIHPGYGVDKKEHALQVSPGTDCGLRVLAPNASSFETIGHKSGLAFQT